MAATGPAWSKLAARCSIPIAVLEPSWRKKRTAPVLLFLGNARLPDLATRHQLASALGPHRSRGCRGRRALTPKVVGYVMARGSGMAGCPQWCAHGWGSPRWRRAGRIDVRGGPVEIHRCALQSGVADVLAEIWRRFRFSWRLGVAVDSGIRWRRRAGVRLLR